MILTSARLYYEMRDQAAHGQVDIFMGRRVGQARQLVYVTYCAQAPSDAALS